MVLENDIVTVLFDDCFLPTGYIYQKTGDWIAGASVDSYIALEQKKYELKSFQMQPCENGFLITSPDGHRFSVLYTLNGGRILCAIRQENPLAESVKKVDFSNIPLLTFPEEYSYTRDYFDKRQWYEPAGRGLTPERLDTGAVLQSWPQPEKQISIHACGFNGKFCAFLHTDFLVMPLVTSLPVHERFPARAGMLTIGINELPFVIRGQTFDSISFSIVFSEDLNGDGIADECDYQLALKKLLPAPCEFCQTAFWYKIMNDNNGCVHTSFQQTLSIIEAIYRMTGGARQIAYLTGWQYTGHDTGYPSIDKINTRLGTYEELLEVMQIAKVKYNCIISVHINVDDTYREHPGWNPDVVCKDVDGSLMTWEVFNGRQAYHVSHTKDVASGDVFRRLDKMLALLPLSESIHIDAFRNTNYSWEEDGWIGPVEEMYCGMLPIVAYCKDKGLDVTTEGLNGMPAELAGVFSGLFHRGPDLPVLYHGIMYGGGRGTQFDKLIIGSNVDVDFTYAMLENGEAIRQVALYHLLYRYLCNRNMLEYRHNGKDAYARYDDETIARSIVNPSVLDISRKGVLIADNDTRFIPLEDGIYTYSDNGGIIKRKLPSEYQNMPLKTELLYGENTTPCLRIIDEMVYLHLPPRTLVRISSEIQYLR